MSYGPELNQNIIVDGHMEVWDDCIVFLYEFCLKLVSFPNRFELGSLEINRDAFRKPPIKLSVRSMTLSAASLSSEDCKIADG